MESGARAIQQCLDLLAQTDGGTLVIENRGTSLRVAPADARGFEVTLYHQGDESMVSAAQWHSHFDDPEEAAWCVRWLLSPYTRVIHELKGGILAAVWIERFENDQWIPSDPAYFLNPEYAPDWILEPGQKWFRRTLWQSPLPFPPGRELPVDFSDSPTTTEVERAYGVALYSDDSNV